jgi:hypothetical protein
MKPFQRRLRHAEQQASNSTIETAFLFSARLKAMGEKGAHLRNLTIDIYKREGFSLGCALRA